MKKILVPCDFSDSARQAYKFAIDIAAANGGEVILVKVIDLTPVYVESLDSNPYYLHVTSVLKELEEDAWNDFEVFTKAIDAKNVKVTFVTEQGTVCRTLLNQIHKQEADLVVMGTHGVHGLKEFLLGSNNGKIVQCAPVPVFVIHHAQSFSRIKNIIFPTEIDLTQNAIVEKIKALQSFFNATLHLLYIKTPVNDDKMAELEMSLRNMARFYDLNEFTVNVREQNSEEEGILKFATDLSNSIIAMGTHGNKGLKHFIAGSIAESVANHSGETIWTYSIGAQQ
ncbi:universal stress protein [Dyadobacter psychrotolerans]|nr:universal stress protein [Dyadobacter psychrotolerans]